MSSIAARSALILSMRFRISLRRLFVISSHTRPGVPPLRKIGFLLPLESIAYICYPLSTTINRRSDVTVDGLGERALVAAPGVLAPAQLHVVRHRRGRPDGAHRAAGGHQHRARAQATASLLQQAARQLSQQRREARLAL